MCSRAVKSRVDQEQARVEGGYPHDGAGGGWGGGGQYCLDRLTSTLLT